MMLARRPETQVQSATKIIASKYANKKGHIRSRLRVALLWKPEVIPVFQIVLLLGTTGLGLLG
jgi:hypothetical protein